MVAKEFATGIALELMTGRSIYGSYGDDNPLRRVTKLVEHLIGRLHDAYATSQEVARAQDVLCAQHPWLAEIEPPSQESSDLDSRSLRRWADTINRQYGRNLTVKGL